MVRLPTIYFGEIARQASTQDSLFDDFPAPEGWEALPRHPALFIFTLLLKIFVWIYAESGILTLWKLKKTQQHLLLLVLVAWTSNSDVLWCNTGIAMHCELLWSCRLKGNFRYHILMRQKLWKNLHEEGSHKQLIKKRLLDWMIPPLPCYREKNNVVLIIILASLPSPHDTWIR